MPGDLVIMDTNVSYVGEKGSIALIVSIKSKLWDVQNPRLGVLYTITWINSVGSLCRIDRLTDNGIKNFKELFK